MKKFMFAAIAATVMVSVSNVIAQLENIRENFQVWFLKVNPAGCDAGRNLGLIG